MSQPAAGGRRPWSPDFVDDVLAAMRARRADRSAPYPYEALADRYPVEEIIALMEDLEDEDITESGVSLRTGWVRDYLPDIDRRIADFKASRGAGAAEASNNVMTYDS